MRWSAKKVKKTIFKVLILGVIAYVVFVFVDQHLKIKKKNEELNKVKEQIAVQKEKNQEMRNELESGDKNSSDASGGKDSGTIVFENVTE